MGRVRGTFSKNVKRRKVSDLPTCCVNLEEKLQRLYAENDDDNDMKEACVFSKCEQERWSSCFFATCHFASSGTGVPYDNRSIFFLLYTQCKCNIDIFCSTKLLHAISSLPPIGCFIHSRVFLAPPPSCELWTNVSAPLHKL